MHVVSGWWQPRWQVSPACPFRLRPAFAAEPGKRVPAHRQLLSPDVSRRTEHDADQAADFYKTALTRDPEKRSPARAGLLDGGDQWQLAARHRARRGVGECSRPTAPRAFTSASCRSRRATPLLAEDHLNAASTGPIGELTSALARAWVKLRRANRTRRCSCSTSPSEPKWAQYYLRYHKALIADIAGRRAEARAAYERVFKQDSRTLRTALAYAQHAAQAGDAKLAKTVLKEHLDRTQGEGHPLVRDLNGKARRRRENAPARHHRHRRHGRGLHGLGEALTGEGGVSIGLLYLQMALYLKPEQPFALAALANAYEATKQYEEAIAIYDRIPAGTPLQGSIEIRKAFNLNSLDRVDEAKALLEKVAAEDPKDLKALDALGNIMRSRKRYAEAAEYYTRAIETIQKPERRHWTYYYSRGTCYERLKKWPQAEADLQKALQLYPDQPLVLNYLGYSWIDQNRNLKQGMALIEKAVSLKPDDGYIVDSLGWAHYRLGNYKEAVRFLERAVELRPEDPVLNDHLGDALWRVGREREARYQWEQSLTLQPEPEDADKIKKKLAEGA